MKASSLKTVRKFVSQWLNRLTKQEFVCQNNYNTIVPINGRNKVVGCALSCVLTNKELVKASKKQTTIYLVEKAIRRGIGKPLSNSSICYPIVDTVAQAIDLAPTNKTIDHKKSGDYYFGLSGPRAAAVTKRHLKNVLRDNGVSAQDVKAIFA